MIPLLPNNPPQFPHPHEALDEPDGLLAAGGQLTPEWLLLAYQHGIFPWFNEDDAHILWWSPSTRPTFQADNIRINRSLKKSLNKYSSDNYTFTINENFEAVISACAAPRRQGSETWISDDMIAAYQQLHQLGYAQSVEMWQLTHSDDAGSNHSRKLVGGFYGIQLGAAFFGESMFSHMNDASKVCFVRFCYAFHLAGGKLIDSQIATGHMQSLGAIEISREKFLQQVKQLCNQKITIDSHSLNASIDQLTNVLKQ